jgi:FkbM family methyltransferase
MDSKFINKVFIKLKNIFMGEFPKVSYSRSGEDLLIDELLNYKLQGFYIDIGAYHPVKYSNTFKFYLRGWTGINIEPNSEAIELFNKVRSNDLNLNLAVSEKEGVYTYYMNEADPTMNTMSKIFSDNSTQTYGLKVSEQRQVKGKRLDQIIAETNTDGNQIDFLNIDVEGHDFEVLKSNNWNKIRPKLILIELNCSIEEIRHDDIYKFLVAQNYVLVSYTFLNPVVGNAFFKKND